MVLCLRGRTRRGPYLNKIKLLWLHSLRCQQCCTSVARTVPGAQATIYERRYSLLLVDGNTPKIDVGRQTVPVIERMRIISFVTQLVVSRRQSDYRINFPVLTRTACVCSLRFLHLPHA